MAVAYMTSESARRRREFDATVNSMQPAITLRPADASDAPAIARIWHAGWPDGHLGNVPDALLAFRDEASFGRRAAERIPDMTVAVVNGDVVGFTVVVADELEQIYVAATHRGLGVADALIADAERRIRAAGHGVPRSRSCRATLAPGSSMSAVAGPTTASSSICRPRKAASQ